MNKASMITTNNKKVYYQALVAKKSEYEGLFFVGVTTTGIFCRPTCPAKTPKLSHCEFFQTAQQALLASYRPCKRCRPLSNPCEMSPLVQKLIDAVEANPEKRWQDKDFRAISADAATARRQFKKRFGMTFVAYARARRMGIAMKNIRTGEAVISAQLAAGYESSSGFRDAFSQIMGAAPTLLKHSKVLKAAWFDTCLGPMIAIADEEAIRLLEFVDRKGLEREVERLRQKMKLGIVPGQSKLLKSIERELNLYLAGKLSEFTTPFKMHGTPFQKRVWQALLKIPYGETRSYADIAKAVGKPSAFRAVANANGANQISLVIPCHRVINTNGEIGGYGGGISRKAWLINLEKNANEKHKR